MTLIHDEASRDRVIGALKLLDLTKEWDVHIRLHKRRRTLSQNRLMWMWYEIIGKELGYDPDELHEVLKEMFLPPRFIVIKGKEREVRSTKKLNTAEMTEYLNAVDRFAASEGIVLPTPEELLMA